MQTAVLQSQPTTQEWVAGKMEHMAVALDRHCTVVDELLAALTSMGQGFGAGLGTGLDSWAKMVCTARFPRSMVGCSQPMPMPHRRKMMNDTTVRAMASAQEAPFLDVLQHQGLAVAVCDVGLAPPADEGGVRRLGGATHGGPRRDQSNRPDWMCFAGFLAVLLCEDGAATAPGEFCATACAHNAVSRGRAADGDAYAP